MRVRVAGSAPGSLASWSVGTGEPPCYSLTYEIVGPSRIVTPDFRSDPMESPEGRGIARRAWDAYASRAKRVLTPAVRPVGVGIAVDLIGFWIVWHLHGGFEGLEQLGMSRATIYRKIKAFRSAYGVHPDEYVMPGVTLDRESYWSTPYIRPGN